jgi:Fe-S-cluster containining protein
MEAIYAEIPSVPSCTGACATACGPIVMFDAEWKRVKRAAGGRSLRYTPGSLRCPMLNQNGQCTVYSVRPYICRLWGTTPVLACPEGCEPDPGWLSREEAQDIFERLCAVAGPGTNGPVGVVDDIWAAFALEARQERATRVEQIRQAKEKGQL